MTVWHLKLSACFPVQGMGQTTHCFFIGIYGWPCLLYTDYAPSLVKAAGTHDWGEIVDALGNKGTVWKLTAKGCS